VGIGCAGEETIGVLHGIDYLEHPGTRLGQLEGNPVHRAVTAIADRVGLAFVLNLASDAEGRWLGAAAGEPDAVLRALVTRLGPSTWAPVGPEPFDAVMAGVGAPKDANLYQASRALTYLTLCARPVVRPGGWVLLSAPCDEGAGRGPGEREFLARMREAGSPEEVAVGLRRHGFGAGGQRAFVLARALTRFRGMVVGAAVPEDVTACHLEAAPDPAAAVARLSEVLPAAARVLVVPHGLATLPTPDEARTG
jgi:nickel-dependent lactate racemase